MKLAWRLVFFVSLVAFLALCAYGATTGTEEPTKAMLWLATAIAGVAAIPIIQIVKRTADFILLRIPWIGQAVSSRLMTWIAWGASYGVAAAVYAAFGHIGTMFQHGLGIFTSGSTVGMIATAVYALVGDKLGLSRSEPSGAKR